MRPDVVVVGPEWVLGRPTVTAPIIGAIMLRHLQDAIAAFDIVLDDQVGAALESPQQHRTVTIFV